MRENSPAPWLAQSIYFILNDNNEAIPCSDYAFWAQWRAHSDRHVGLTEVIVGGVTYTVSTVFLGIDHGFPYHSNEAYQPILFETMIYHEDVLPGKSIWLNFQRRYRTWKEAAGGHADAVRRLQSGELLRQESGDED